MIFGFGRKNTGARNVDRDAMIAQDKTDISIVLEKWHPSNRFILGVFLANDWRFILDTFDSPSNFARMPKSMQVSYLEKLLAYSVARRKETVAISGAPNAKSMELMSESYSARFLASYVICLMENDREWEDELAPKLDQLATIGWATSWASMPLQSDKNFFPIDDPAKPHTSFVRPRGR